MEMRMEMRHQPKRQPNKAKMLTALVLVVGTIGVVWLITG